MSWLKNYQIVLAKILKLEAFFTIVHKCLHATSFNMYWSADQSRDPCRQVQRNFLGSKMCFRKVALVKR